jgi:hypothetical protein
LRERKTSYGYFASKKEYYHGVKLRLVMTDHGVMTDSSIHAATLLILMPQKYVLDNIGTANLILIVDKGYYDGELRTHLDNLLSSLAVSNKKRHHF